MKRYLIVATIMVLCFSSYGQSDGLYASNSGNNGSDDKSANVAATDESTNSDAWKHIKSGMQFDQTSDMENAIKEYGIAIDLDNDIAEAYDYRAVCYIKLGKYRKAMHDLENAIDLNPSFVDAYNHIGVVDYWLKDYQQAINFYTRAISLNPAYATPYFNRAIVYLAMDENQLALKDLNKAKELKLDGVDPVLQEFFADKK